MLTVTRRLQTDVLIGYGNFIEDKKPDVIVDIGDWGDFDSISKYTRNTQHSWGATLQRDIDCFQDASHRAFGRINKIKGYNPSVIRIRGNHDEGRIHKFVEDNPELIGLVNTGALRYTRFAEVVVPFCKVKLIDGIAYCHYFYDKDSRYPIQSARAILNKKHQSSTWGHSHARDMAESTRSDGRRVIALNAGCFLDPKQSMDYAGPQARDKWWSGLVLKHDVHQGSYDPDFWSIERIQREYS